MKTKLSFWVSALGLVALFLFFHSKKENSTPEVESPPAAITETKNASNDNIPSAASAASRDPASIDHPKSIGQSAGGPPPSTPTRPLLPVRQTNLGQYLQEAEYTIDDYLRLHPEQQISSEQINNLKRSGSLVKEVAGKNGEVSLDIEDLLIECPQSTLVGIPLGIRVDEKGMITEAVSLMPQVSKRVPAAFFQCHFQPHYENGVAVPFVTEYTPNQ